MKIRSKPILKITGQSWQRRFKLSKKRGLPNPYEALKELTRTNDVINQEAIHRFVDQLRNRQ